ncbi:GNAT family N-acetyltransferase [Bradyrhizobium sp. 157]|uniref:GNAT family N-acetyltransferase n=1 Tax=Bradyrhizobium sp. 157 TaxID=2782631 RepID=UPI00320977E4
MVPTLETPRLCMRPRAAADVDAYVAMDKDIEVRRFITPDFRDNFDVNRYQASLRTRLAVDPGKGLGWWTLRNRFDDNSFLGMALLIPLALEGPEIEIGWRLPRSAWGNGYATEAALRVVQYARDEVGLKEIIACINPENERSVRVANKLGFRPDGRKRAYGTEFDCYRLRLD